MGSFLKRAGFILTPKVQDTAQAMLNEGIELVLRDINVNAQIGSFSINITEELSDDEHYSDAPNKHHQEEVLYKYSGEFWIGSFQTDKTIIKENDSLRLFWEVQNPIDKSAFNHKVELIWEDNVQDVTYLQAYPQDPTLSPLRIANSTVFNLKAVIKDTQTVISNQQLTVTVLSPKITRFFAIEDQVLPGMPAYLNWHTENVSYCKLYAKVEGDKEETCIATQESSTQQHWKIPQNPSQDTNYRLEGYDSQHNKIVASTSPCKISVSNFKLILQDTVPCSLPDIPFFHQQVVVAPSGKEVYFLGTDDKLFVYQPQEKIVKEILQQVRYFSLAKDGSKLYVVSHSNYLSVLDTQHYLIEKHLLISNESFGYMHIAPTLEGSRLYILGSSPGLSNILFTVDLHQDYSLSTHNLTSNVTSYITAMAVSNDGSCLYLGVTANEFSVWILDTQSYQIIQDIQYPSPMMSIALSTNNDAVYVSMPGIGMSVTNTATYESTFVEYQDNTLNNLALDPHYGLALCVLSEQTIVSFWGANLKLHTKTVIKDSGKILDLAFSPDSKQLYVTTEKGLKVFATSFASVN